MADDDLQNQLARNLSGTVEIIKKVKERDIWQMMISKTSWQETEWNSRDNQKGKRERYVADDDLQNQSARNLSGTVEIIKKVKERDIWQMMISKTSWQETEWNSRDNQKGERERYVADDDLQNQSARNLSGTVEIIRKVKERDMWQMMISKTSRQET